MHIKLKGSMKKLSQAAALAALVAMTANAAFADNNGGWGGGGAGGNHGGGGHGGHGGGGNPGGGGGNPGGGGGNPGGGGIPGNGGGNVGGGVGSQNPDDYDVAKYQQLNDAAQQRLKDAQAVLAAKAAVTNSANGKLSADQNALDQTRSTIEKDRNAISDANSKITQLQGQIRDAQNKIAQIQSDLPNLDQSIKSEQGKLASLQNQQASAKQSADRADASATQKEQNAAALRATANQKKAAGAPDAAQADAAATAAESAATQARSDANTADQILATITDSVKAEQDKIAQLQSKSSDERNQLQSLTSTVNSASAQVTQEQNAVSSANQEIRSLQGQVSSQQQAVQADQSAVNAAQADQNNAQAAVNSRQAEADQASARLAQVKNNLSAGIAAAQDDGRADGTQDGTAEGTRRGTFEGSREGGEVGAREGREKGTREGIERAEREGGAAGQQQGIADGNAKGQADGDRQGQKDGSAKGNADGLAAGYEAGRQEGDAQGYQEGTSAGHNMGAYDKGKADGTQQGAARAVSEGKTNGHNDGYAKASQEFYDQDLNSVTIPNRSGGSAVYDRPGSWDNQRPRRQYPIQPIQQAYNDAYAQAFHDSAGNAFDQSYKESYEHAYHEAFEETFRAYASQDYPNERKQAYDAAYAQAYTDTYKAAFNAQYQASSKALYDSAYSAALPQRHDEGKRDGYNTGYQRGKTEAYNADYSQGQQEGDKAAYDATYPGVYNASFKTGYNDGVSFFSNNAVLKFDGGLLTESTFGGIFAPNDPVQISLALKNFGKTAQKQAVQVRVSSVSSGLLIQSGTDTLARIPGQTRAVITGIGSLRVAPDAEVGSQQTAQIDVIQGGETLGSVTLNLTVGYPFAVPAISVSDLVTPNQPNSVQVRVSNLGSKAAAQNVTVRLVSLDGLSTVLQAQADVGALQAGAMADAQLSFQFPDESAYKPLNFEIQVLEGSWLLGKRDFTVDTTKRYKYDPSSAGLIVVGATEISRSSNDATKASGLGFDIYDVRVEGPLTAEVVSRYAGKTLIIPSVSNALDGGTASAVDSFLSAGGTLYAGLGQASGGSALAGLISQRASAFKAADFDGLQLFEGNRFNAKDGKYEIATASDDGQDPAALAERLVDADLLARTIGGKVTAFLANQNSGQTARATRASTAILRELVLEMQDDKAVGGKNYKNNRNGLLLTQFINITLGSTGSDRKALLGFYPELEKARKNIGWILSSRRAQIKKVLKPLADAYKAEIKK